MTYCSHYFKTYCLTEFQDIFPSVDIQKQSLTAITISQQSRNDMSIWNAEVELERESLLQLVS
jgi:hypothetical protein